MYSHSKVKIVEEKRIWLVTKILIKIIPGFPGIQKLLFDSITFPFISIGRSQRNSKRYALAIGQTGPREEAAVGRVAHRTLEPKSPFSRPTAPGHAHRSGGALLPHGRTVPSQTTRLPARRRGSP